ncbi:MAG: hypothetical protein Q7R99_03675 [bacterium]|nr:hypothetical protein [bacterium]
MKKLTSYLSISVILLLGSLLSTSKAYADIPVPPGPVSGGSIVFIGAGVGVGIVVLISWLVIRAIRKKKNVINK